MKPYPRTWIGALGAAHVLVAIALLPSVIFASGTGLFALPLVMTGLIWLAVLGWRLRRPTENLRRALRFTHLLLAPFAIWLLSQGFVFLNAAHDGARAGGGQIKVLGVIALVMGFVAGALSIVSFCVSFSSTLKVATAPTLPARAEDGSRPAASTEDGPCAIASPVGHLPVEEDHRQGRVVRLTIRCLALVHYAWGMGLLLLAAWFAFSVFRVLPHMSSGTIWTNLPIVFIMAAVHAGPLAVLGIWITTLGRRTWRGHPGLRTALVLTHGLQLLPGILTAAVGFFMLRAGAESAARGGGLLSPIGIFPLAAGGGITLLAVGSIVLALTVMPKRKETQELIHVTR